MTVPDVLEIRENDARGLLDAAELEIEVVCLDPNDPGLDEGLVYKTEPRAGSEVDPHSTIRVFIKPPCG